MIRELPYRPETIGCRFVFNNPAGDDICREWVQEDIREARLSLLFRAYYRVRSLIPVPVRRLLQRYRRVVASPQWYLPTSFVDALTEHIDAMGHELPIIHPWPDGCDFAFVLTHDVESAEGVRRVSEIADLDEEYGFRSSWNFVPHKYGIDRGLLRDLTQRGFEVGVHGFNHDGRLFTNRDVFNRRAAAINAALHTWNAVGFRAPMVHRNLHWLQSLEIQYDASCFDTDPYQPMPGGVGSIWPFIAGRFVELPYTMPQDHTLFVALKEQDARIWQQKLDYISSLRGMSLIITHPDYLDFHRSIEAYRSLLQRARDMPGIWHALPKDVAAWWRARDAMTLRREMDGNWSVEGPGAARARCALIRPSDQPSIDRESTSAPGHAHHQSPSVLQWHEPKTAKRTLCQPTA